MILVCIRQVEVSLQIFGSNLFVAPSRHRVTHTHRRCALYIMMTLHTVRRQPYARPATDRLVSAQTVTTSTSRCRASVQDMTTDGSGAQQLQPGLRQGAGRQQPTVSGAASGQPPQATSGIGAIAFASAGTLDKPAPTADQKLGTHDNWFTY